MKIIKTLPFLLCACVLISCTGNANDTTITEQAPVTAIGDHQMEEDKLYSEENDEFVMNKGNIYGIKFSSSGEFQGIKATAYSKKKDNATVTVRVYKWNNDYTTTVASKPVEEGKMYLTKDKTEQYVNFFDPDIEEGEYLITLEPFSDGSVLSSGTSVDGGEYFFNGESTSTVICIEIIRFT